jgi:hypothetical protein
MRRLFCALVLLTSCYDNVPSVESGGYAGSVGAAAQELTTQTFTVVNSNSGAQFVMTSTPDIIKSAVRLHVMSVTQCQYQCNIVGNSQTFCKHTTGNCYNYYTNPQNPSFPYLVSVYFTDGPDINHTTSPNHAWFLGNTDFNPAQPYGHRFHHVYDPMAGGCAPNGAYANGDVLHPNSLPNNNIFTITCP